MKVRSNLCDNIAEEMKKDIISGVIKPGEKIPGEFELAEKFEVSRFTVREAMKKLDSMGLITIKHGVGSFVNEITPGSYMKPLLPMLMMSDTDVERICEVRLPLEVQAISLCVERASEEDIHELEDLVALMEEALEKNQFERYNELDVQFHLSIAEASKNRIIYEILNTLQDLLQEQMKRVFNAPESKERSIRRHKQMVDAISNREEQLCRQIMTLHINDSIHYLLQRINAKD